jgi:hypothetical protein
VKIKNNIEFINNSKGKYIRFGGRGIIDGLKRTKVKYSFYKIISADKEKILLKRYRSKNQSYLQNFNFDQEFEIIDKAEFQKLPIYD